MSVQSEYETAAKMILCDCGCHPQSTLDCSCVRAGEMRAEIHAAVEGGKTAEAIVASYVARYGEKILVSPPVKGFNLVAWLGPGLGIVAATLVIVVLLRRWRRGGAAASREAAPMPSDVDAQRLARALREFDR